jgi:hypothetical protein
MAVFSAMPIAASACDVAEIPMALTDLVASSFA